MLFTDGSVNTKSKMGCGAYLVVDDNNDNIELLKVKITFFKNTSSTKLELQTLLWALNNLLNIDNKIFIYTDSQNIIGLGNRRKKLEENNFYSGKGKRLNNYELYQQFYKLSDQLNFELIKVEGHLISSKKSNIDKLFSIVDKASRKALREKTL